MIKRHVDATGEQQVGCKCHVSYPQVSVVGGMEGVQIEGVQVHIL